MKFRVDINAILWMLPGAVLMLLLVFAVAHFKNGQSPADQAAFKTKRVDLVSRMQLGLASESEAEKSAVMAITDEESKSFADQARATTAEVQHEYGELNALLNTGGTQGERDQLANFSKAFFELQRIDADLLVLAVRNSNLKAYNLAFGPAADAVNAMNAALSRIVTANASSPDASKIMLLAFGAQTSALRIQNLLPPHIAEESSEKMDSLEASMAKDDQQVHSDFDGLTALPKIKSDPDLATAISSYEAFTKLRTQILALSRENTNVRSLTISLTQKRRVAALCQDALSALKQAILDEPVRGAPVSPR